LYISTFVLRTLEGYLHDALMNVGEAFA